VQDAFRVRGGESGSDAAGDLDGFVVRETADAVEQASQVFAVDILHRDEVGAFPIADVVDAADVRMRDLPPEADFVVEEIELGCVLRQRGGEELERDLLAEFQIVRAVNLAHPAGSEDADDAIAAVDDRARRELRVGQSRTGSGIRRAKRRVIRRHGHGEE